MPCKLIKKYLLIVIGTVLSISFVAPVLAVGNCSPYLGLASLNEFFKDTPPQTNDIDDYVEVKILDTSISPAVYSQWSIQVCEENDPGNNNDSDGCSGQISLGDFTDTTIPWLVLKNGTIGSYFNFKTGFDAILLDSNDDVIDYLSVDGYALQEVPGCTGTSLPYDYQATAPGASDKFIVRSPDGTGDWESAQSAAEDASENTSNDDNGSDPAPNLTFSDIPITQGTTTATVTLNLDAVSTDPITISFYTIDGTLLSGVDYTAVNTSGTFAPGETSLVFNVPVSATSNLGNFNFFISIDAASTGTAIITSHNGSITVVGLAPDHYAITHSGPGVTCEAESITLTAHNASHGVAAPPSSSTTITLSTSITNDGWALQSGSGTFIAPNQYTFDGAETSVQFWLRKTSATTAPHMDIDVSDGTTSDLDDGGDEDLPLQFSDTGFRFYADGSHDSITTQIAGKPSDIAPGVQALTLRAVETNTDTGACDARFAGTTQTVQMAFECVNPTSCQTSNGVMITDTTLAVPTPINDNPQGNITAFSNVDLRFNATGVASWKMNYADAGQIALHANLTIPASGNDPADTFTGTSNIVVRPFGFDIDSDLKRVDDWLDGALDGTGSSALLSTSWALDAGGKAFVRAGNDFNVTLRPVLWEASDDTDNNGVPDLGANLTDNSLTQNFGNETVSERVDIVHTKILPSGAGTVDGILTGGQNLDFSGSNKILTTSLSWDEVGIIDLTASLDSNSYLLSGSDALATHQNFGRFYPDHFELVNISPVLNRSDESCLVPSVFSYMGENFQMSYDIIAVNSDGDITQNYTTVSGFAKLDNTGLNIAAVDLTIPGELTGRITITAGDVTFVAGRAESQTDTLNFNRLATGAADGTYQLSIGVAPVDDDDVELNIYDLDVDNDAINDHGLIGATFIYYGRMSVANAYGSELIPLNIPIRADYYDSLTSTFMINGSDNCTSYNVPLEIDLTTATYTAPLTSGDLGLTGAGNLLSGSASFSLHDNVDPSTGPGVTGEITYNLDVPAYLQFDWDGVTGDEDPSAKATFGIYSGDSKQIYYRQIYQ